MILAGSGHGYVAQSTATSSNLQSVDVGDTRRGHESGAELRPEPELVLLEADAEMLGPRGAGRVTDPVQVQSSGPVEATVSRTSEPWTVDHMRSGSLTPGSSSSTKAAMMLGPTG